MLRRCLKYLTPLLAMGALVVACGGDDESPTEPVDGEMSDAAVMFRDLNTSISGAMGLMLGGGGTLEGVEGEVVVSGTTFTLNEYSPNGEIVLNGELTINILATPVTIDGEVVVTGAMEGDAEVHMTVDTSTLPYTYGGTVKLDDELYQVADLVEEGTGG